VHRVLPETPQIRWPLLDQRVKAQVWVKHENHTPIGTFKIRGALFYIAELRRKAPEVKGVPIGLGSGICGTIAARNALGLKTKIIGVVASGAPAYALSFQAREPVSAAANTMADGMACRVPNPAAVDIITQNVDHFVTSARAWA